MATADGLRSFAADLHYVAKRLARLIDRLIALPDASEVDRRRLRVLAERVCRPGLILVFKDYLGQWITDPLPWGVAIRDAFDEVLIVVGSANDAAISKKHLDILDGLLRLLCQVVDDLKHRAEQMDVVPSGKKSPVSTPMPDPSPPTIPEGFDLRNELVGTKAQIAKSILNAMSKPDIYADDGGYREWLKCYAGSGRCQLLRISAQQWAVYLPRGKGELYRLASDELSKLIGQSKKRGRAKTSQEAPRRD